MKRLINSLFLIIVTLLSVSGQNNIIDEVVWVVGDDAILKSDVEAYRLQALYEGHTFKGDPYCVIPEQLAIQKLFLHQADLDSIIVTDNDVIAQVDRQINYMMTRLGSKEKMEEYFGKSLSEIREEQRENAKKEMTIEEMKKSLLENVSVTPSEVRNYYENLPVDSIPIIAAQTEVEIITIEPAYPEKEVEEIKARLREFTKRINNGESFAMLARLYSQDTESAKIGGELGFHGKGELWPEFAKVAFNLTDPQKVSRIVQTEDGFHIIQLIEKRGDRINCRHIRLTPQISATERNKALLRLDSIANLIRNGKISFEKAASYYSYDKDTRNNGGLMVNSKTGDSHFKMQDLPQDIGKKVYYMNLDEISEPFTMRTDKNKEICAIIHVKSKTKAHKATVSEDFQQLKAIVLAQKKEKVITDWIRQKQKEVYVRIDKDWCDCDFQYPGWVK